MPRRLVLLFDGTWNRREHATNVWRMRLMLRRRDDQLIYYDEGVGTTKGETIRGGGFGYGLSAKVLRAYLWLMENFEDATESPTGLPDEVFIFGFSRGAFTARSLVGLISICGLLRKDATRTVLDAFRFAQLPDVLREDEAARRFRLNHGRNVRIAFLGLWDTVGALGLRRVRAPFLERYSAHKTSVLPPIVDYAVHALALDERRKLFKPEVWESKPASTQYMEQRWFVGAHANVGGGYDDDGLFLRPLQWIQSHASALDFSLRVGSLADIFHDSFPRRSLDDVGYGAYYTTQWLREYHRHIALGEESMQTIDYSVFEKWAWNDAYECRPLQSLFRGRPSALSDTRQLSDAQIGQWLAGVDTVPGRVWKQTRPDASGRSGFTIGSAYSTEL